MSLLSESLCSYGVLTSQLELKQRRSRHARWRVADEPCNVGPRDRCSPRPGLHLCLGVDTLWLSNSRSVAHKGGWLLGPVAVRNVGGLARVRAACVQSFRAGQEEEDLESLETLWGCIDLWVGVERQVVIILSSIFSEDPPARAGECVDGNRGVRG